MAGHKLAKQRDAVSGLLNIKVRRLMVPLMQTVIRSSYYHHHHNHHTRPISSVWILLSASVLI